MAYVKNTWVDQQGQVRYTETEDDGYKIFTANYEEVTEIGTPVNADNMNHIENGIKDNDTAIITINSKIPNNASDSNKMVTQADIDNKANIDGSNMDASVKNFDGQWVDNNILLSNTKSAGTYEIDLSPYLPEDNFAYELFLGCYMRDDGDARRQYLSSSIITVEVEVNHIGTYADLSKSVFNFPVGADKKITYRIDNNVQNAADFYLHAYRRIGTNN